MSGDFGSQTVEETDQLKSLMRFAPDEWFTMHPVSSRVNAPRNDDATLIESVAAFDSSDEPDSKTEHAGKPRRNASDDENGLFDTFGNA